MKKFWTIFGIILFILGIKFGKELGKKTVEKQVISRNYIKLKKNDISDL